MYVHVFVCAHAVRCSTAVRFAMHLYCSLPGMKPASSACCSKSTVLTVPARFDMLPFEGLPQNISGLL